MSKVYDCIFICENSPIIEFNNGEEVWVNLSLFFIMNYECTLIYIWKLTNAYQCLTLLLNIKYWWSFDYIIKYELWANFGVGTHRYICTKTHTQTERHINTMTRPGPEARTSKIQEAPDTRITEKVVFISQKNPYAWSCGKLKVEYVFFNVFWFVTSPLKTTKQQRNLKRPLKKELVFPIFLSFLIFFPGFIVKSYRAIFNYRYYWLCIFL